MGGANEITYTTGWEDTAFTFLAQIYGNAGVAITQATISSISCKVFDLNAADPTAVTATLTPVVASTVFDTMQTDAVRWTEDTTGFNFAYQAPGSTFPTGGNRYRLEFTFTPSSGEVFRKVFVHTALAISGS